MLPTSLVNCACGVTQIEEVAQKRGSAILGSLNELLLRRSLHLPLTPRCRLENLYGANLIGEFISTSLYALNFFMKQIY
jgi:hypothetical protein